MYSSPNIIIMIQVEENDIARACSTHGGEEESVRRFGGKAKRKESTSKT
jgi:hypothetical protein